MKKISHKTIFILLGLLVLLFVTIFGLQYFKSEYGFKEVELPIVEEVEQESETIESEVIVQENIDSIEENQGSIVFQKFIEAGYLSVIENEFTQLIDGKQNLLNNIYDLNLTQEKQPLEKIINGESCFAFSKINKTFCNASDFNGISAAYSYLGFLDGYYYLRVQLYEGFYNLRVNEISGHLDKIGDNFVVYDDFIVSDNEIDNASKISIYQNKKGFINHVIAEPGSFVLKKIYETETNKLIVNILNEKEENLYFSINLLEWIEEQKDKEKKDEQVFQYFLDEVGGEEISEEEFNLSIQNQKEEKTILPILKNEGHLKEISDILIKDDKCIYFLQDIKIKNNYSGTNNTFCSIWDFNGSEKWLDENFKPFEKSRNNFLISSENLFEKSVENNFFTSQDVYFISGIYDKYIWFTNYGYEWSFDYLIDRNSLQSYIFATDGGLIKQPEFWENEKYILRNLIGINNFFIITNKTNNQSYYLQKTGFVSNHVSRLFWLDDSSIIIEIELNLSYKYSKVKYIKLDLSKIPELN